MSEPLQIEWEPLPDDGRECPLLRVNPWNQINADAYLLISPNETDPARIRVQWMLDRRPGNQAESVLIRHRIYWQTCISIDIPSRARLKRLQELRDDMVTWVLIRQVSDGWTLSVCDVTGMPYGTLDAAARDALRTLRQHVRDVCAPRLPARDALKPAQPI